MRRRQAAGPPGSSPSQSRSHGDYRVSADRRRFPEDALRSYAEAIVAGLGASPDAARVVADSLIEADRRGVHTHGLVRLASYCADARAGRIAVDAVPRLEREHGPTAALDGLGAFGAVTGTASMDEAVARGTIKLAELNGEPIPIGWALDPEGHPTTDPTAALVGALLPSGGHKGSGLAFAIEVLTGVLAGGDLGPELINASLTGAARSSSATRTGTVGSLYVALDPACFVG